MSGVNRIEGFSSSEAGLSQPADSIFEKIKTIAIFRDPVYAYISKAVLDSEGIECFLSNNCTAASVNLFTRIGTGYKLKVRQSEMNRAVKLLLQESEED